MSFREQQKYLDTLKKYESKFNHIEAEEYKMLLKMQKDDEDFDSLSFKQIKRII